MGASIAVLPNLIVAEENVCIAPCDGDVCTYTAQIDLYASELGYFTFKECGDISNPTIGMQVGKTYRFVQVCEVCKSTHAAYKSSQFLFQILYTYHTTLLLIFLCTGRPIELLPPARLRLLPGRRP
jgi:hypothetical protein